MENSLDVATYILCSKLVKNKLIKDFKVNDDGKIIVICNDDTEIEAGDIASLLYWTDIYY